MNKEFSKDSLMQFIQFVKDKGLIKAKTAQTWQVAASRILTDLEESELNDIRTIDLDSATYRLANKDQGSFLPETLNTYRNRVSIAIQEFISWRLNPTGYKPRGFSTKENYKNTLARSRPKEKNNIQQGNKYQGSTQQTRDIQNIVFPFPLQSNFMAEINIPKDLTIEEAKRLGAFLLTVAIDYNPNHS